MHRLIERFAFAAGLIVVVLFSIACSGPTQTQSSEMTAVDERLEYDEDSWRKIIPSSCQAFFDGCNNCRRTEDALQAACTRKACFEYQRPRCLDGEKEAAVKQEKKYSCNGNKSFVVFYGEYHAGDQQLRLNEKQVMLVDHQTNTAYMLMREQSASGIKFGSSRLEYWAKGNNATLFQNERPLYSECRAQG